MRRSDDELLARASAVAWGRAKYPTARVVHELVTGVKRIDLAFILPDRLIGVEVKGPRDVLGRLAEQMAEFRQVIPELWVATDVKWCRSRPITGMRYGVGRLITRPGLAATEDIPTYRSTLAGTAAAGSLTTSVDPSSHRYGAERDVRLTVPMLHLLWRDELHALAARHRIVGPLGVPSRGTLMDKLARGLTGDEIVSGVCAELRGRDAFQREDGMTVSDPPVPADSAGVKRSSPVKRRKGSRR